MTLVNVSPPHLPEMHRISPHDDPPFFQQWNGSSEPSTGSLSSATLKRKKSAETPPSAPNGTFLSHPTTAISSIPKRAKAEKPRWHTQTYMLFHALRTHPENMMPRTALIKKAIELDKQISKERKLPLVFRGKTPMNSASAALTNNADRIFVAKRPPGARTTFFSLAWIPGDVDMAIHAYHSWMEVLMDHDWPLCFANMVLPAQTSSSAPQDSTQGLNLVAAAVAMIEDVGSEQQQQQDVVAEDGIELVLPPPMSAEERSERARQFRSLEHVYDRRLLIQPAVCDRDHAERMRMALAPHATKKDANGDRKRGRRRADANTSPHQTRSRNKSGHTDKEDSAPLEGSASTSNNGDAQESMEQQPYGAQPEHVMMEEARTKSTSASSTAESTFCPVVLNDIPKKWQDVVLVQQSSIPNAGRGLFAKRDIPGWTPIGFYFGVPIPEDEFDAYKERVGVASRYAIMYRRTVLDATDADGNTWEDVNGPIYCPFHFMNEDPARGNVAFVEGSSVNQVICMTTRYVHKGEELFAYYGTEIDRDHYEANPGEGSMTHEEEEREGEEGRHPPIHPPPTPEMQKKKQRSITRIASLLDTTANMSDDATDGMDEEELTTMGAFVNFVWDGKGPQE